MALHKTLAEVETMSGPELAEWHYHFRQEPMTDHFWIGAQICQVITNMMGSGKGKRLKVDDFLPRMKKRKQTPEEMAQAIQSAVGQ